jgi:hypothetical protein
MQARLDEYWRQLIVNDPETVIGVLDDAFEDNEAPSVPIDVVEGRATVVLLMESADVIPDRQLSRTAWSETLDRNCR